MFRYGISEYFRESIRHEIRLARERFSGQKLSEELRRIQKRLDTVELLTPDIVINLLLSYRDIQVCVQVLRNCIGCIDGHFIMSCTFEFKFLDLPLLSVLLWLESIPIGLQV